MRSLGDTAFTTVMPVRFYDSGNVSVATTNTDVFTVTGLPAKYRVRAALVTDQTGDTDAALLALRTGAAGGGTALVAAVALTGVVTSDDVQDLTIAVTKVQTAATLYFHISTPSAAAATVRIILEILDLS